MQHLLIAFIFKMSNDICTASFQGFSKEETDASVKWMTEVCNT